MYHPVNASSAHAGPPTVLLYLPRGPLLSNEEDDASTISVLRSNLPCSVVQVNYRLSHEQQYPTPVHDVLAGYDWILENLLPKRAIIRAGRPGNVGKVAVCGELIGGGLATALALTESRIGEPGVTAAAISNPVVDWVAIDSPVEPEDMKALKESEVSVSMLDDLRRLRKGLFSKPEKYFDPFASPILFFRSAGIDVPYAPAPVFADDMERLSSLEREDFDWQQPDIRNIDARETEEEVVLMARRRASKRYPSKALGLRLPSCYVSAGITSPLNGQARELAHLLRQSFIRQMREATVLSSFGKKVPIDDEDHQPSDDQQAARKLQDSQARENAELKMHEGIGLWDRSVAGQARVLDVANWLKHKIH